MNFMEIQHIDVANQVNLDDWTFVGFSERRGYIFKRRAKSKATAGEAKVLTSMDRIKVRLGTMSEAEVTPDAE